MFFSSKLTIKFKPFFQFFHTFVGFKNVLFAWSYSVTMKTMDKNDPKAHVQNSQKITNYVNSVLPILCLNILEFLSLEDQFSETWLFIQTSTIFIAFFSTFLMQTYLLIQLCKIRSVFNPLLGSYQLLVHLNMAKMKEELAFFLWEGFKSKRLFGKSIIYSLHELVAFQ